MPTLENFAYGDTPTRAAVQGVLRALSLGGGPDQVQLSLRALSTEHDMRELVAKTLITWLDLDGWLIVTDFGMCHSLTHLQGGPGDGITAQVN